MPLHAPTPLGALLSALLPLLLPRPAAAAFSVSSVFGSRMVLQRDSPALAVWGRADAGTNVTLELQPAPGAGQPARFAALADDSGAWVITLGARAGSLSPTTLVLTTPLPEGTSLYLSDVLFGDVYLSLGQSNAQIPVGYVLNASEEMAAALLPQYAAVRTFQADRTAWSFSPQAQLQAPPDSTWGPPNAYSIGGFSALGWFTARYLTDALNGSVAIGVVSLNWGATSIQSWSSPHACAACGGCPPSYNGWVPPGPTHPGNTSVLWNSMYLPYATTEGGAFAITGATWMQGEDNAQAGQADYYVCALPALVAALRGLFGSPQAWVGVVQLGPWAGPPAVNDGAAGVRQAQLVGVAGDARVVTVTAADGGDPLAPQVIHSRRKQLVARRLAAAALSVVYGRGDLSPAVGPVYASATATTVGATVTVEVAFAPGTTAGGLVLVPPTPGNFSSYCPTDVGIPADNCGWFAVQTSDGAWRNATAALGGGPGGDRLVLAVDTSPATGLAAVATSSGWALWPVLPLRNLAGLPAFPWRHNISA